MKTVGDKLDPFKITGIKPGFNLPEENGISAFETITESSFPGKWKVIYFYAKDFNELCRNEIANFARVAPDFESRDAILLGGSADSEFAKLGWRRENPEMSRLNHYQFADCTGDLIDQLAIRDRSSGMSMHASLIVDHDNVIQHISVTHPLVGRNPEEALRLLDALLTGEPAPYAVRETTPAATTPQA